MTRSVHRFDVWGMTGTLAVHPAHQMDDAVSRLWHWIERFDAACNRFRPDSEISRINTRRGETVEISDTLARCLEAALWSARATDGLCDPTVLAALKALGYDRDYDEIAHSIVTLEERAPVPAPGIQAIDYDTSRRTLRLNPDCELDLGASAKALLADLVVGDLGDLDGVVVEIGGDVALAGEGSQGPWVIGVSDRLRLTGDEPRISQRSGGIATSSTTTRTWRTKDQVLHHIIDPRTGRCANGPYATATVSAESCVVANAFATAALLWGEEAGYHIAQAGWSARLVRHDGSVEMFGGWPEELRIA